MDKQGEATMTTESSPTDAPVKERIGHIRASMRCFFFSLMGLVPCVGLPFSVAALIRSRRLEKKIGTDWNPAGRYLKAAARLSPLGIMSTALFATAVCLWVVNEMSNPGAGFSGSS